MKFNSLDLNKVAVFCQIIDSGNYQRASEVLNVTPSALSQTVSGLEYALGFPLFDRVGKRLVPTAKGLVLHREFRAHHTGFLRALKSLGGEREHVAGLLRIGAYLEFAKSQLSGLVAAFAREYPEAQLKFVFDTPTRLQKLLQQGQLDVCFSIFPARDKGIRSQEVIDEELVLIAPRALFGDTPPTYKQVMSAPMIEYYVNHQPIRRWLWLHFQKRAHKIPVRVYASTAEMVISLVRAGAGIGVVPFYLLDPADRSLRVVRPTSRKLTDHIWMLEKSGGGASALHNTFTERVRAHFGG